MGIGLVTLHVLFFFNECLPACMYVYHVSCMYLVPRGQKRVSDPLVLKLQMAVNCHGSAESSARIASV